MKRNSWNSNRIKRTAAALASLCLLGCDSEPVQDLRHWVPYRTELISHTTGAVQVGNFGFGWLVHDVDRDGRRELFYAQEDGVLLAEGPHRATLWESRVPTACSGTYPCAFLDGCWDVDGDGTDELVSTSSSTDGMNWILQTREAATGRVELTAPLPVGVDFDEDGVWDGSYRAVGTTTVFTDEGPRPAILLVVYVARDLIGRGVLAVDALDGSELWRHETGPQPQPLRTRVVDVNEDGRPDVVLPTAAVNNMNEIAGLNLRDDHVELHVLDADGVLLWRHQYPVNSGSTAVLVDDFIDAPGLEAVVLSYRFDATPESRVTLHRARDGAVLSDQLQGVRYIDLNAGPAPRSVLLTEATALTFAEITPTGFQVRRVQAFDQMISVKGVSDVLPDEGPEILLTRSDLGLVVLSRSGATLLDSWIPRAATAQPIFHGRIQGPLYLTEPSFLVERDGSFPSCFTYSIERRFDYRWLVWLGLAALGTLLVLAIRGLTAWIRRWELPWRRTPRRTHLLRLLDDMAYSRHGGGAVIATLNRYLLLSTGGVDPNSPRLAELRRDVRERILPVLNGMTGTATAAGLDSRKVTAFSAAWTSVRCEYENLDAALATGTSPDGRGFQHSVEVLHRAIERLWQATLSRLETPLQDVVAACLSHHRTALESAGVEWRVNGEPPEPRVTMDRRDLEYVLDNLIENAARAMTERGGQLSITWRPEADQLHLQVVDTGCGIAPELRERIFEPGFTTRSGGGQGLARSVFLLKRTGGSMHLDDDPEGPGAAFSVILPSSGGQSSRLPKRG